jgi:hypothetical protein
MKEVKHLSGEEVILSRLKEDVKSHLNLRPHYLVVRAERPRHPLGSM